MNNGKRFNIPDPRYTITVTEYAQKRVEELTRQINELVDERGRFNLLREQYRNSKMLYADFIAKKPGSDPTVISDPE